MWYSNVEEMCLSGYTNGEIHRYLDGEIDRIVPRHGTLVFHRHPSWKVGPNEVAEVHVASWDASWCP